jgi:hypothetical protein
MGKTRLSTAPSAASNALAPKMPSTIDIVSGTTTRMARADARPEPGDRCIHRKALIAIGELREFLDGIDALGPMELRSRCLSPGPGTLSG